MAISCHSSEVNTDDAPRIGSPLPLHAHRYTCYFLRSASLLLVCTGTAKLTAFLSDSQIMQHLDPVFGIPTWVLTVSVGIMELMVAFLCLFTTYSYLSLALLMWLGGCFLIYRLWYVFPSGIGPCGCFGAVPTLLRVPDPAVAALAVAIAAYLLLGSSGLLLYAYRRCAKSSHPSS